MDGGEAKAHLRLDGDRPDDLQVPGALDGVAEQCGLPHTGLTPEDQRAAHSPADAVENLVQRLLLRARGRSTAPHDGSPDRYGGTVR